MADILTHLRELSVGVYFFNKQESLDNISPSYFLEICIKHIKNCSRLSLELISSNSNCFNKQEKDIINNGFKLAKIIQNSFNISNSPNIIWVGPDTQCGSTVDLIINEYRFSLKEQSYILENMGLYKLLNILTDSDEFTPGLHIFEKFAFNELNEWFNITRDLLIKQGPNPFILESSRYKVKGCLKNKELILEYIDDKCKILKSIKDFNECSYEPIRQKNV